VGSRAVEISLKMFVKDSTTCIFQILTLLC